MICCKRKLLAYYSFETKYEKQQTSRISLTYLNNTVLLPEVLLIKFYFPKCCRKIYLVNLKMFHCMKSVQKRSFFWSVFSLFPLFGLYNVCSTSTAKYGPEKTPYLDTFTQCSLLSQFCCIGQL